MDWGLPQENKSQHLGEVSVPSLEVGGHHPAVLEAGLGDPHLKIRRIRAAISLILFTNKIFMSWWRCFYLVVYETVADPHDQEGEASVGRGEVDHNPLLVWRAGLGQQVGTEVRAQSTTVPGRLWNTTLRLGSLSPDRSHRTRSKAGGRPRWGPARWRGGGGRWRGWGCNGYLWRGWLCLLTYLLRRWLDPLVHTTMDWTTEIAATVARSSH